MKHTTLFVILFLSTSCSTFSSATTSSTPTLLSVPRATTATTSPTLVLTPTIIIPTLTPLPPENAEDTLLDLLQSNADCLFPCWFGFTPGETSAQLARPLLEELSAISLRTTFNEAVGGAHWRINKDGLLIDTIVSFTYNRLLSGNLEYFRVTINVKRELENGGFETVWENPLNQQYLQTYRLPLILSTYGQPEEVLIFANEGWRYFELMLDYSDQGFAIWYSAPLESSGEKFLGCLSKAFTKLYLWAPEFNYTWAEGVTGTGDKSEIDSLNRDFRPLEDVTSISEDEFYTNIAIGSNLECLETSKEFWPGP